MRNLLRDLYFGNIAPAERQTTPNSDLQRELERVSRFETQLRSRLNEAERPLLSWSRPRLRWTASQRAKTSPWVSGLGSG